MNAQPYATFFLLPTRAWELLLGSMMSVLPVAMACRNAILREIVWLVGLAGIFLPVFFYGEQTPFPGLSALPPCLGTALLIFANAVPARFMNQGYLARAVSAGPMGFIGLISYSLYLWHWPVLCFASYWAVCEFTVFEKLGLAILSMMLALISWKFIESPFRKGYKILTRPRIFALAGVSTGLVLAIGLSFQTTGGFPSMIPEAVASILDDLRQDEATRQKFASLAPNITNYSQEHLKSLPRIGVQDPKIPISFAVLGDSHAQVAMAMFDGLAKKHNRAGVAITHQGTPPLIGWDIIQRGGASDPSGLWNAAFEFIQAEKIQDVFLLGYWRSYDQVELDSKSVETIQKFANAGINVWMLMGAPTYNQNVARMYLRTLFFRNLREHSISVSHEDDNKGGGSMFAFVQERFPDRLIDASKSFYDHTHKNYRVDLDHRLLYFDGNHLTLAGNMAAYADRLDKIFIHINE